jgi:hypothetical protein
LGAGGVLGAEAGAGSGAGAGAGAGAGVEVCGAVGAGVRAVVAAEGGVGAWTWAGLALAGGVGGTGDWALAGDGGVSEDLERGDFLPSGLAMAIDGELGVGAGGGEDGVASAGGGDLRSRGEGTGRRMGCRSREVGMAEGERGRAEAVGREGRDGCWGAGTGAGAEVAAGAGGRFGGGLVVERLGVAAADFARAGGRLGDLGLEGVGVDGAGLAAGVGVGVGVGVGRGGGLVDLGAAALGGTFWVRADLARVDFGLAGPFAAAFGFSGTVSGWLETNDPEA